MKHIIPQLAHDEELMSYFDTEQVSKGKLPEKKFFWGIMHTVRKELTHEMLTEVLDRRINSAAVSN